MPTIPAIDMLTADHVTGATPVYLITSAGCDAFLADRPAHWRSWAAAQGFKGEAQKLLAVPAADGGREAVLLGVGKGDDGFILGAASAALPAGDYVIGDAPAHLRVAQLALGWALGTYQFDRYKTGKASKSHPRLTGLAKADLTAACIQAEGVMLGRNLVNLPSSDMGPAELEAEAREVAAAHGAKLRVVTGDELLAQNYPMIHAVGRASVRAPRLIEFIWGNAKAPKVTLVGKGVCFDSGGLDLKPASAMALMKKDMGGAAAMLGLAHMLMAGKAKIRLRLMIPAVENAVSGDAYRPGDVLRSRKGLTVEIGNTDAEGRLVLADALCEADEEKPDLMVCMATLTGAARTATGFELPPFFTADDALAADLMRCSTEAEDSMWRLPLWANYEKLIEGKVADITNSADSPHAGAITAALFLKRFVTATPRFVHFDVAAWVDRARPGRPLGGEAQGIRALYALIKERFG